MNVLDSSLEALPINPVNLGPLLTAAINNIWAWLAVVTAAAFSFWPLRNTATSAKPRPSPPPDNNTKSSPSSSSTRDSSPATTTSFKGEMKNDARDSTLALATTTSFGGQVTKEEEGVLTRGDSFKNRFTVTYSQEKRENDDDDGGDDDDDAVDGGDETVVTKWAMGRRLTVKIGRRDMGLGWYGYQDRRVIDGSVVRLWEEERESSSCCSSPRSCRRSPLGVGLSPLVFA